MRRHRHRIAPRHLLKFPWNKTHRCVALKLGRKTVSNPIAGRKAHSLKT
jgi:hypothetical protein